MDQMCQSQFWDTSMWSARTPYFTVCFRETVLLWIPCIFITLFATINYFRYNDRKSPKLLVFNRISKYKIITSILLIALSLCEAIYSIVNYVKSDSLHKYQAFTSFIKLLTFTVVVLMQAFNRRKGIHTSGILFIFWCLMSISCAINLQSLISQTLKINLNINENYFINEFTIATTLTYLALVLLQLVLSCFSDAYKQKMSNPKEMASFFSKLWFWWFSEMIYRGFKNPLIQEDMWKLSDKNQSKYISDQLDAQLAQRELKSHTHSNQKTKVKQISAKINIIWPIFQMFRSHLLFIAVIKLIPSCLTFVSPIILNDLIGFMKYGKYGDCQQPLWHGFYFAILMFISSTIESVLNAQYDYHVYTLGMRFKSALISVIYRKVLKLSPNARKVFTTGDLVNIMSTDVQRVMEYIQIFNLLWICPLMVTVSIYFLWQHLQYGSLAGILVMILLLPINVFIGAKIRRRQIQLLQERDKRTKLMSEILNGIRVLKMYAWETSFVQHIRRIRDREMTYLRKQAYLSAFITFAFNSAPFLVAVASFATYILIDSNNVLDAQTAFVSLSIFNILRRPLAFIPQLITSTMNFFVSIRRINKFINSDELLNESLNTYNEKEVLKNESQVWLRNASFKWDNEDTSPVLSNITLDIKPNKLIAIVGKVGCGKSSFLSSLLGEMELTSGHAEIRGSIAYVPQQAWIQNASVRSNVLFGKEYKRERYNEVIHSCALEPDFTLLSGGDLTEIGEKGINLSGGQKQRISLARAVYNDADVYLLDDPLSAVDSHVGKHIFDKVIGPKGLLKNKTRILVTHKIAVLPHVDEIVVLKDGLISECGSYSQLIRNAGSFAEFLAEFMAEGPEEIVEPEDLEIIEEMAVHIERQLSRYSSSGSIRRRFSLRKNSKKDSEPNDLENVLKQKTEDENKTKNSKLISTEEMKTGSVGGSVYLDYVKAIGILGTLITVISYIFANVFTVVSSVWLSDWSNDEKKNGTISSYERLEVYAALVSGQTVFILIASITLSIACLRGSNILHDLMLDNVIRLPMSFFDTTPTGRILNRFSKDIDVMDITLLLSIRLLIIEFFRALASIVIIALGTPYVLISFIPLGVLYYAIQKYYISTSRQLKRLESVSRSPIFSHFSETVTGASSIRAYNAINRFIDESNRKVDSNHSCYYASLVSSRWLTVRLEFLGNCVVFFTALFAVFYRGTLSPGNAGLSISYALTITATLNLLIRASTDLESNVVSVERILEYTKVGQEAKWFGDVSKLGQNWPPMGSIGFTQYSARYRDGLDLILKDISVNISPGTRVGIVGRTGAGKSSLTLALFRLIESASGSICIDGIAISSLGLQDLRSRLTIIPQEPVLFTGSLRMNLDPFNRYTDHELWTALELAHLKDFANALEAGLDHQISEGGDNLSVGQKQLVCLARALLKKSKILVLDEATAAVDLQTDELIQKTIRKEFFDSTMVTIAHRLNTIMDYDKVIVMDRGQVVEYDSPNNLLNNKESLFYSMVKDSNNQKY